MWVGMTGREISCETDQYHALSEQPANTRPDQLENAWNQAGFVSREGDLSATVQICFLPCLAKHAFIAFETKVQWPWTDFDGLISLSTHSL